MAIIVAGGRTEGGGVETLYEEGVKEEEDEEGVEEAEEQEEDQLEVSDGRKSWCQSPLVMVQTRGEAVLALWGSVHGAETTVLCV